MSDDRCPAAELPADHCACSQQRNWWLAVIHPHVVRRAKIPHQVPALPEVST